MSEPVSNVEHPPSLTMPRSMPIDDRDLEDGPLFRATVTQLESKTSALKQNVKRILKAATASLEAKRAMVEADEAFIHVLQEIPSMDPLFTHYLNTTAPKMHEQWERMQHSMQSLLIDPLQKLYEMDIKAAEAKRRQFDDESKQYYAYLSKYLSIKKDNIAKKDSSEAKHQAKKHHFDISKFEYLAFLDDLHGGKKNQEIMYYLLSYYQKQFAFYQAVAASLEPAKPGLDGLASLMADVSREQDLVNKERNEKRKLLGMQQQQQRSSLDEQHPLSPTLQPQQQQQQQPSIVEPPDVSAPQVDEDKFRGIRDLQQQPDRDLVSGCGRRKEGFLFATSKPLKSTNTFDKASGAMWHKYWCVVSGGQLHEYSNWKGQLQTHIEPINLRFATAREARNTERRFCFEVITTHFRRVYQATSQEEMQSWMATINNAIESLLNGMSSSVDLLKNMDMQPKSTTKKRHGRSLSGALRLGLSQGSSSAGGTGALGGTGGGNSSIASGNMATTTTSYLKKRASNLSGGDAGADLLAAVAANNGRANELPASSENKFRWSGLSFGRSSSTSHHNNHHRSSSSYKFEPTVVNTQLLSQLKQDPSNRYCADCGDENPDWCSLNLGIVLCIECSGIHRSLGTHISKVRSLTLDCTSYTPDIVALLRAMGNARSNAIWAANATEGCCAKADDNRQIKLNYIQTKYVDRAFVAAAAAAPTTEDPQTLLNEAIDTDAIPAAMHAIALGANINACRITESAQKIPLLSDDQDDDDEWQSRVRENSSDRLGDFYIRYPLHFALLHGRASVDDDLDRDHVYPMAELLLQNGADTGLVDSDTGYTLSELVGIGHVVDDEAITYLNSKNSARGQSPILRSSMPPPSLLHDDCESHHASCTLHNDISSNK
ncbi:hypothetical protein BDB00DRAFT_978205 [Zychaea mexicana]|uniref:uncharacterized protein n=1 Tax=Zychaea mexicana TaxID=64656 RepID=UPI0022FE0524|nr:uncharacterized protein BDB00DRAFT_978205 [Zychaea mexicana]KAI9491494.1 hypothetical protein BDB00DRAFT_978205 [Zychaea mexicana]